MDIDKIIKRRRSIRFFQNKKVAKKLITKIINSANYAPSACNKQAWRFIIITNKDKLKKITSEGGAYFIKNAPLAILVIYENLTDNIEYADHIQSAAAAVENMQLKISSLNLGSCWVANLPKKATLRKIFKIPAYYDPIALLVVGYPKSQHLPIIKRKHSVNEIISFNKYQFENKLDKNLTYKYKIKMKRIIRISFFSLPFIMRKFFLPVARRFEKKFFL